MYLSRSWNSILLLALSTRGNARLVTVPTVPFVEANGSYALDQLAGIVVDIAYANTVDHAGQTLIPPTLYQFAETFQEDFHSSTGLSLPLNLSAHPIPDSIFLTLTNDSDFQDAAGRPTAEAYTLEIHDKGITIAGASPLGAWWGTRSLIQATVVTGEELPQGSGLDAAGWGIRGIMLDAARHYYPPEFLIEMCSYISFFKQNVFHVHLSDNLYNNVERYSPEESMELYATFRLRSEESSVAGLNKRANESYSYDQFNHIQRQCAQRGVTVIPEIEAPGHALVIVQWQPELGLDDLSMLNISHPDTIPTMKAIWETFLPWFHSKTVHIGADEYDKDLITDYTEFVNQLNSYISEESGKAIRIWGTFTPKEGANVSTEVSIQHWAHFEDDAYYDFIKNGYDVLNSDDAFYIVAKWSDSYPQRLNKTRIFHGNPAGGAFAPNIFDVKDASRNPAKDNDHVLGHVAALWNDFGPNATTVLEAYYSWRDGLPALADKQWGGDLLEEEYDSVFVKLHAAIPAQNLDRQVPSKTDTVLHYKFDEDSQTDEDSQVVPDLSGNGYDGTVHKCDIRNSSLILSGGCYLETPLTSKGRDYTLSFSVKPTSETPGVLFAGPDSMLKNGNGSISNVTFISGGNPYSLNYSLPLSTWTDVRLVGKGAHTIFTVGSSSMEFLTRLGLDGRDQLWAPIAIEAPLKRIGEGFTGMIKDIVLLQRAE